MDRNRRIAAYAAAAIIAAIAGAILYTTLAGNRAPDTWAGTARAHEVSRFGPTMVVMGHMWDVAEVQCRDGGMRVGLPDKGIYVDVDDNARTIHAWRDDYSGHHDYGTHSWDGLQGKVTTAGTATQHHEWTVRTTDSATGNPALVSLYGTFYCTPPQP